MNAMQKAQGAENRALAVEDRLVNLEGQFEALQAAPKSTFWGRLRWLLLGR